MALHSSTLAWKIPWMEEPGRLQSMGSRRVGPNSATSLSLFTFMHWRRKWQPTPVFLPGKSRGRGSLVGCHLWGRTESDTTEATQQLRSISPQSFLLRTAPSSSCVVLVSGLSDKTHNIQLNLNFKKTINDQLYLPIRMLTELPVTQDWPITVSITLCSH